MSEKLFQLTLALFLIACYMILTLWLNDWAINIQMHVKDVIFSCWFGWYCRGEK